MILLFTYFFYSLNGYSDSLPRPVFDHRSQNGLVLQDAHSVELVGAYSASPVREQLPKSASPSSNISIANSFGSKKFPQAIIIGVKKGGTRALLEFLRIHPDVRAVGAEPHFFDRFYDKGLEWYRYKLPLKPSFCTLKPSNRRLKNNQIVLHSYKNTESAKRFTGEDLG